MAYYFGEEDENKQGPINASKPSSVIPGGQVAATDTTGPTASSNNARTNPGNFVGISQYLDANKPQTADLANKVGGVITGAADTASNELKTKAADTQNQINSNTIGYDPDAINQLNADASKADVNKINSMKNATYQGPSGLGNIDSLANAQQAVKNADTEEGRRQLVGSLYQNQPLKKGALTFDNLLLQASPEAKAALANAKTQANLGGLQSNIDSEKSRLEAAANTARDTTANTAKQTAAGISGAEQNFEKGLQRRVDAQRQAALDSAQSTLARLTGIQPTAATSSPSDYVIPKSFGTRTGQGTFDRGDTSTTPVQADIPQASSQDLSLLGISQDQYGNLVKGLQGGYLDPNALGATIRDTSGINAGNVASAEDYARYNVLKRLAGGGNFLGDDASLAGTYNPDLLDYTYSAPVAPQLPATTPTPDHSGTTATLGTSPGTAILPSDAPTLRTDLIPNGVGVSPAAIPTSFGTRTGGQGTFGRTKGLRTDLQPNGNFPTLGGYSFY